ncbi:Peptidase S1 domain-containing protein [Aphelenchoides fujianensis]|nr:Peptidase S1 domain-containing protein [Aphelenchoides fujianensis]
MRLLLLLVVLRAGCDERDEDFVFFGPPGESPYFDRLSAAENAELQRACGRRAGGRRLAIENGDYAAAGDVPWAASVSASSRVELNNRCGATIISPRHLLTATHCFFDYASKTVPCSGPSLKRDFDALKVSFGGVCLRADAAAGCACRDVQTARLRRLAILRSFHDAACEGGNDLAILELSANIRFDEHTQPVCLLNGSRLAADSRTDGLQERVHSLESFAETYPSRLRHFFSRFYEWQPAGGADILRLQSVARSSICSGDSGAGAVAVKRRTNRSVLLGVHSYSEKCARGKTAPSDFYAVTSVHEHRQQICFITGVCPEGV